MYIEKQRRAIFEIRMSAGELEQIYENSKQEMYIVKDKKLYGPLHPCEIHQIVLAKFKEVRLCFVMGIDQQDAEILRKFT